MSVTIFSTVKSITNLENSLSNALIFISHVFCCSLFSATLVDNWALDDDDNDLQNWLKSNRDHLVIRLPSDVSSNNKFNAFVALGSKSVSPLSRRERRKLNLSSDSIYSFLPSKLVSNLRSRLADFQKTLEDKTMISSCAQEKFVIISETFLQMYNLLFCRMFEYIVSENQGHFWTKQLHQQVPFVIEEFTDFTVSKKFNWV